MKNSTARATSAGVPKRPTGIWRAAEAIFSLSGWNDVLEHLGLRNRSGRDRVGRDPYGASSSAQVRVKPSIPALVEEYAVRFASPSTARVEIKTMRP